MPMGAADRAADGLRARLRHPSSARRALATLEALGAYTLADRVDRLRSDSDLVPVTVPAGPGALRSHRFRMYALDGRDQVARALRGGGWNSFEAPLPSVVAQLVRRWPHTVLDVGANTGLYSLIAITADRRATAIAYEPVPEIAALLRDNLAANLHGDRVTVREVAIGDRTGAAELHLPPAQVDGTVETSASLEPDFKETIARVVRVEAATLDDAWRSEGRPTVSLVKVDVEGAEHRVLGGAEDLIDRCRPVLTIEVLTGAEVAALESFRHSHRYVDVTLGPAEAVVDNPTIHRDEQAPNHLLVPRERLDEVIDVLGSVRHLRVTRLG
jgi:FkbM family methyltransferase